MAGKVKAGAAFVEIGADDKKFAAGLKRAAAGMKKFAQGMVSVGKKLLLAGAAMLAPLALSARAFAKFGDNAAKMSRRTGIAAQSLVEFGHAAELTGANMSGLEKAIKRMQTNIVDAGLGLSTPLDALQLMNLTLSDLKGLSPEDQFLKIGEAVGGMANVTQRAGVANKFFGRSGTQLLPLFSSSTAGLKAMRAEARLLFGEMGEEGFAAAEGLTDRFARFKASLQGVKNVVGSQVEPALSKLLDRLTSMAVAFRKMLADNPKLVEGFKNIALNLVKLGAAFTAVGAVVLAAMNPAILVFAGLTLAITSLLESVGVLNTGVNKGLNAIFDSFTVFGKTLRQWAAGLKRDIVGLFDALFLGILDAMIKMEDFSIKNLSLTGEHRARNNTLEMEARKADANGQPMRAKMFRDGIRRQKRNQRTQGLTELRDSFAGRLTKNREKSVADELGLDETNKGLISFTELLESLAKRIKGLVVPIGAPVPSSAPGFGDDPSAQAAVPAGLGVHGFFGGQRAGEQVGATQQIEKRQLDNLIAQTEALVNIRRILQENATQGAVFA